VLHHGIAETFGEAPTPDFVRTSDYQSFIEFSYQFETELLSLFSFSLGVQSLLYRASIVIPAKSARQGNLFPKPG
jgi:hypothetical protein